MTPSIIAELICFIIACICLRKDSNKVWRTLIIYLLITCATEKLGLFLGRKYHTNQWLYNIFLLFEFGFTGLMFMNLFSLYTKPRAIMIFIAIVFAAFYWYDLFEHGFLFYNNKAYTSMSVEFVLCSLYFYYLLINDERHQQLWFSPEFWWVAGVLFFYFGNTASNLFDYKLYSITNGKKNDLTNFIFKTLNIILYSCWSYSFICRKWLTTESN